MSLWYQPITDITFENVESFCRQRLREGVRLDYKSDWPRELERIIAAFANTLGGLVLLGVRADKTTNEPIWPPCGIELEPGIEERIVQKARDAIYPPVRPSISSPLPIPGVANKVVVVVRVDESPEAPHAVNQGIYIPERTENQNDPIKRADIRRIERLLDRRRYPEERREHYIESAVQRGLRVLRRPRDLPIRWASVIPLFPWRDLCEAQKCCELHESLPFAAWGHQRIPGGSLMIQSGQFDVTRRVKTRCSTLSSKGHVFGMELTEETALQRQLAEQFGRDAKTRWVDYEKTREFATVVFVAAKAFYEDCAVEHPGLLSVRFGLRNVFDVQFMRANEKSGQPFPDQDFMAEITVPTEHFLEDLKTAVEPLMKDMEFGLDQVPR